jgi:hypothetical protein
MSKRPSKRNTELERLHEQYASWVVSHRLSDGSSRQWSQKHRFFDISVHSKPLIEWLDEIDRTLDPKVLLPLLNIPPEARPYFEALFEGLDFKHNHKSRRRRFQPTEHQQKLLAALLNVKKNRRSEQTQAEAIEEWAKIWGVSKSALEKAVKGQHTSLRRRGIKARGTAK